MQKWERGKISMDSKSMLIYSQEIKYWFGLPRKHLLIMLQSFERGFQSAIAWEPHRLQTKPCTRHSSMACWWECSIVWLPNYSCGCSSPYREHRKAQLSMRAEHQTNQVPNTDCSFTGHEWRGREQKKGQGTCRSEIQSNGVFLEFLGHGQEVQLNYMWKLNTLLLVDCSWFCFKIGQEYL